ncbi:MAG: imidazole glycerol phosphate synthase subunit HisH [Rickettsiales bacterium]
MSSVVTIVDYGVGNLHSVARAFEHVGAGVEVTSDVRKITQAERLVLPGVGAFGHCMEELEKRGLTEAILKFAESDRPFLGICVGMQIMLEIGEEFGEHKGLGLMAGRVQNLSLRKNWIATSSTTPRNDDKIILPVIGWMELKRTGNWQGTILSGTAEGSSVYFVHSFEANPDDKSSVLAQYEYDGINITAAVSKNNLTGVQFHPEKSGLVGINMLKGWA